jgi:hypothetical protein
MTSATTLAYAFDVCDLKSGAILGAGLVVPSDRHLSYLADGAALSTTAELNADLWRELENWIAEGDRGLPSRPAPLSDRVVAALPGVHASVVSARRVAAIPIPAGASGANVSAAATLLPHLLRTLGEGTGRSR